MTDGQQLYLVFAILYLVECLHWLPRGCIVLSTWRLRRGWSAVRPSSYVGSQRSGVRLAWPLPLLGGFLPTQAWAVIPDEAGLWIGPSQANAPRRLVWAELQPTLEERRVILAPGLELKSESLQAAKLLHHFLEQAAKAEPAARADLLSAFWKRSLSLPAARAALRRYRLATSLLRLPQLVVFFLCFGWLPYLYYRFGDDLFQLGCGAAALLLATGMVAFGWRYLHRRFFPEQTGGHWGSTLHLLFMPMHAIRAHDQLGVEMFAGLHPLVAASTVLPREALRELASQMWRGWSYRQPGDALEPASRVVLPHLQALLEQRLGFARAELEPAPKRDHGAESYCPRCLTQFTSATTCEACGGIATKHWPAVDA